MHAPDLQCSAKAERKPFIHPKRVARSLSSIRCRAHRSAGLNSSSTTGSRTLLAHAILQTAVSCTEIPMHVMPPVHRDDPSLTICDLTHMVEPYGREVQHVSFANRRKRSWEAWAKGKGLLQHGFPFLPWQRDWIHRGTLNSVPSHLRHQGQLPK